MRAGVFPLAALLLAGALLSAPLSAVAASSLNLAELAQANSLTVGLLATIGAVPAGATENDYEGQLAVTLEQAGDTPAVVVGALDQALARPGLPHSAVSAMQVLRNLARRGHVRTTAAVGDLVTGEGALYYPSGAGGFKSFKGGSDYTP